MTFPRGAPGMMDMSCMDMSGRNVSYRRAWINVNVWLFGAAACFDEAFFQSLGLKTLEPARVALFVEPAAERVKRT